MDVYNRIKRDLFWALVVIFIVSAMLDLLRVGWDSTDSADSRSGLGLYTDAMTGCQYLSARGSGITPRLDKSGRHICGVQP